MDILEKYIILAIIPIKEYNTHIWRWLIMEYLTTVEMSKVWNITSRRIGVLCAQGRVKGAIKKGKTWLLPADAIKPKHARYKNK